VTGTVKTIIPDKAYGFIKCEDGKDRFFHRSDADNFYGLEVGDRVSLEPTESDKAPRAEQVELLQEARH
jgi:cold shock CspA family protein